ncbi:MAG TPA: pilus assembly protein TadG-related protein [Acidothermaceae bacterium]
MVYRRKLRSGADDSGVVAIIVALFSIVLFGFAALVVDIGHADDVHLQGQNAVDTAALAGVQALANGETTGQVVTAVQSYVDQNMGLTPADWEGCQDAAALGPQIDTVATVDTCISTLVSPTPEITSFQVRVKLPTQHVPATFGGLFGVSSIGISPIAQALSGQPLPPECGPCDPILDGNGHPEVEQSHLSALRQMYQGMLPDPAAVPTAGELDPNGTGCPTTPGLFDQTHFPTGVTIAPNPAIPVACTLHPGLYVFDDVNLDVAAAGSLASTLVTDPPVNSGDPPLGTGVTLVFYGTGTLTVEGHIGTLDNNGQRLPLIASKPAVVWQPGQPIPGVAIVLDQFGSPAAPTSPVCAVAPMTRCFSLGDDFTITGSVYALDGKTTWTTNTGDCMPVTSTCVVHDEDSSQSVLATTATAFSDPDANNFGRTPTVATDHPMTEPPPSAPHLVK